MKPGAFLGFSAFDGAQSQVLSQSETASPSCHDESHTRRGKSVLHAVPTAHVIKKLKTDLEAGLVPGEVSSGSRNMVPTVSRRLASAVRSCGFSCRSTTCSSMCCSPPASARSCSANGWMPR